MKMYELRKKGTHELVGVCASGNDDESDAVSISYKFQKYYPGDIICLADTGEKQKRCCIVKFLGTIPSILRHKVGGLMAETLRHSELVSQKQYSKGVI